MAAEKSCLSISRRASSSKSFSGLEILCLVPLEGAAEGGEAWPLAWAAKTTDHKYQAAQIRSSAILVVLRFIFPVVRLDFCRCLHPFRSMHHGRCALPGHWPAATWPEIFRCAIANCAPPAPEFR